MSQNNRAKSLTASEALYIDRRRRGMTQARYAKIHRTSVDKIHKWEAGLVPKDRDGEEFPCPKVDITWSQLSVNEQCVIMRRRNRMSRTDLADALGVSQQWVSQMERGRQNAAKLVSYWKLA